MVKKIVDQKIFLVDKKILVKIFFGWNKFLVEKTLVEKIFDEKYLGWKNFLVEKKF